MTKSLLAATCLLVAACQGRAPAASDVSGPRDAGPPDLAEAGRQAEAGAPDANEDALGAWLRSEQLSLRELTRDASVVTAVVVPRPAPSTLPRLAYVRAFAERAARAEGLPALDTVDLVPRSFGPTDPALLATRFLRLELRLARPPLDGACIDPRATIELDESDDGASFSVRSVRLLCEKESAAGRAAPPDASRNLPAAAAGKQPFLAICEYVSFAWGYVHHGYVIDKRGDVYGFSGGPAISGTSTSELGMMLRRSHSYAGTIPAAEADRLAALEGAVEREPFKTKHVEVFDAPAGGCSLLREGAKDDALVSVPLDSVGREQGSRVGPASRSAQLVLAAARKLVDATKVTPPSVPSTPGRGCLPFDRGAATAALFAVDLQPCALPNGPRGAGHAKITFAPDGSVPTVTISDGAFVGTPTGACVAQRYRTVKVPVFCPGDVAIGKQFAIE